MTTATLPLRKPATAAWLAVLPIWHLVVALAAAATGVILLPRLSEGLLLVPVVGLLAVAGLSAAAVPYIRRRNHRGRVLSLAVNYLGFLACAVGLLHLMGAFTGIDDLARRFGRGLPFLLLAFLGYLVQAYADHFEYYPKRQRRVQEAGKGIILVGLALFFVAIVNWPGLPALALKLLQPAHLALLALAVLFAAMFWGMWRQPTAEAMHVNNARAETLSGLLFLSPNFLGFLLFFAGPLLLSLYTSFTNWDAFGTRDWVGLDNYARLLNLTVARLSSPTQLAAEVIDVKVYDELARFTLFGRSYVVGAEDKLFWISLRNTVVFCLIAVPLSVIPALFLSNILNSRLPGMKFFRAVYFIPSVAAVVGVSLIWQWMYNSAVGWINYGITVGINLLNGAFGLDIADPKIRWLSSADTALLAVAVMVAWQTMGFNTVLFLAGLQNIPTVLYEAATVDGADAAGRFRHITLPLLAPTTVFVVTTTLIQAFQVFEPIFIMTNPPGGPNNATLSMVLYLYQNGFQRFRQGYASAIAWVLFLAIFVVTLIQFRRQRGGVAYEA
ncbi:MAG: sugar ABC transporter permease [Caldilineales bacterium]|nr:sugar ABC transporter permease [Caldilineales bacterium]MDW8318632.1 sugar ABC transporter permease [Anaerolineae bacterium]